MESGGPAVLSLRPGEHDGPLSGKVAVVTGASKGVGRGVAEELGRAGATVVVTGRTSRGHEAVEDNRANIDDGSVEAAAELVSRVGGVGVPVVMDHTVDAEVDALGELLRRRFGRVDLLVNNVWGGYEDPDMSVWGMEVWEQPMWRWDKMFATGVRAHYLTTRCLLPLMCAPTPPLPLEDGGKGEVGRGFGGERSMSDDKTADSSSVDDEEEGEDGQQGGKYVHRSLIVNISAGDNGKYLGCVQYDVAKTAVNRLAFAVAAKMKDRGVMALALHPGLTGTERVQAAFAEMPAEQRAAMNESQKAGIRRMAVQMHSTRFVGRAVVALATDPNIQERSGTTLKTGQAGLDYGFTDVDGSQPCVFDIG